MAAPEDVLQFWFGELDELGKADKSKDKLWWGKSEQTDSEIREIFLDDYEAVVAKKRQDWLTTPHGTLAYIIVLDQFSRNMFRGTSKMYAADALALEAAKQGLVDGVDKKLAFSERAFFYLPLEHSEDIGDQDRCVTAFKALTDKVDPKLAETSQHYLRFAEQHRDIITRFGRFPHRNEILGRKSTKEELAFLNEPGSSF